MKPYRTCEECTMNSYPECLCRFCRKCGQIGHRREECKARQCVRCKGWHRERGCPIFNLYGGSEFFEEEVHESSETREVISSETTQECDKQNLLYGVPGIPAHPQSTSLLDRGRILEHLIDKVKSKHGERYGWLFQRQGVSEILEANLNPAVREFCESGRFTLDDLKAIGQDPGQLSEAGVYLHVLWDSRNTGNFWLYVGQATRLSDRIRDHMNPYRRKRNSSLHYHVWDSSPDRESMFVTLAIHQCEDSRVMQLLLNLQEMWMALVFQTLTASSLRQYLPAGISRIWPGYHLNVALPLWQSFTKNEEGPAMEDACGGRNSFQQYLFSPDPSIRQWAEDARDSFNDIRNSPDPILRKYYEDLRMKRQLRVQETWQRKKLGNLQRFLSETQTIVQVSHGGAMAEVSVEKFRFTISQSLELNLKQGDEVMLQFHLSDRAHPQAYAQMAQPTDPVSRLAVSIRPSCDENKVRVWLKTKGLLNVNKMNSLVDGLEGYSMEESRSFRRRWHVQRTAPADKSSRKNMYT